MTQRVANARPYPKVGEVFELTLDGGAPEVQPIEMVRRDGYGKLKEWRYVGNKVTGKETRRFKLVEINFCPTIDEVRYKLASHGRVPGGQWREAFKAAYPKSKYDGMGPIGIADASWVGPGDGALFPYIDRDGHSYFRWFNDGFRDLWRWLVEVDG